MSIMKKITTVSSILWKVGQEIIRLNQMISNRTKSLGLGALLLVTILALKGFSCALQ